MYTELKQYSEIRLNMLKEDLVRSVSIPENPFSYTSTSGAFYEIRPFTTNKYEFDVVFKNIKQLEKFAKELEKSDLPEDIKEESVVKTDDVIKSYKISGFFNSALINDIQLEFKRILNDKLIDGNK